MDVVVDMVRLQFAMACASWVLFAKLWMKRWRFGRFLKVECVEGEKGKECNEGGVRMKLLAVVYPRNE